MGAAAKLRVLIVDDEPPARERLRSLLAEIADVEVVGEAVNGHEALKESHDLAPDVERRSHLAARHREGLRLIPIEEVQYFLADQKYTTVRHVNGEDLIEDSLRLLESEFGAAFVRIHRNALVAVKYLERIERSADGQYFVRLRGCEAPLQVSRPMAGELKERFRI